MATTTITDHTPAELKDFLEDIASTADCIKQLAVDLHEAETRSLPSMYVTVRCLAERIGYFADLAGAGLIGGPLDWMMHPAFLERARDAAKRGDAG